MRTRILSLAAAAAVMLLVAGCSAAGSSQSDAITGGEAGGAAGITAPDAAGAPQNADAAVAPPGTATVTTDRQVVKNAYVAMRVDNIAKAVFDVHGLVKKRNGLIASEDTQSDGDSTSSLITAQIPAADLDAFVADVSALGAVDSVTVNAQDVTGQVVDLDARIRALQTSIARMTQLLAQAQKIDDLLAIETQLSTRQSELDSLTAQRTLLGEQVALSSVTMAISPMTQVTSVEAPGFLSGVASGWAAFVSLVTVLLTATGFFLPFAIVALLILVPLTLVLARVLRRRRPSGQPTTQPYVQDDTAPVTRESVNLSGR